MKTGSAKYLIRTKLARNEADIQLRLNGLRQRDTGPSAAENMIEFERELRRQHTTCVERGSFSEARFRVERSEDLGEEKPLAQLRDEFLQDKKDLTVREVAVWDGEITKDIVTNLSPMPMGALPVVKKTFFVTVQKIAPPLFAEYGRVSCASLKNLSDAGFISSVRTMKSATGKEHTILKLASGLSELEYTLIPAKGFALARLVGKLAGAIVTNEEYGNFVQTNIGVWLSLRAIREGYTISQDGSAKLTSRSEYLALDVPQLNIELSDDNFELLIPPDAIIVDMRTETDGKIIPGEYFQGQKPNTPPVQTETDPQPGLKVSQAMLVWSGVAFFTAIFLIGIWYLVAAVRRIRNEVT